MATALGTRSHQPRAGFDPVVKPASFDQLYEWYWDFVVGLLIKLGVDKQDTEDAAEHVFLRLYSTDILDQFDESHEINHRGKNYKTRFQSFLSAKVEHYARGIRERQGVVHGREPLICDVEVGEGGTSWVEVFGGASLDDLTPIEGAECVEHIRECLACVPVRGVRDMVKLFDLIVAQVAEGGCRCVEPITINPVSGRAEEAWEHHRVPCRKELAQHFGEFGISDTAITSMIGDLRTCIRWFEPVWKAK